MPLAARVTVVEGETMLDSLIQKLEHLKSQRLPGSTRVFIIHRTGADRVDIMFKEDE